MPNTFLQPLLTLETLESSMVTIEGGMFEMGGESYRDDAKPLHSVSLSPFGLCRYPVSQSLWLGVMGGYPEFLHFNGSDRPVEKVSWLDCQIFLEKLNQHPRFHDYRLPTEAEWEYAALGGVLNKRGLSYADDTDLDEEGWYIDNSFGETQVKGLKLPNALGLFDLRGNVWEWCQDWYSEKYYASSPVTNPQGPDHGWQRVGRGSSWRGDEVGTGFTFRYGWRTNDRSYYLGFRLARSL